MATLGFSMMQAQQSFPTKAHAKQAPAVIRNTGHADKTYAPVQFKANSNDPIPEGMVRVTLTAGDLYDGTGFQMLLDADATAYGTVFQATGDLNEHGSAEDSVYSTRFPRMPMACSTRATW